MSTKQQRGTKRTCQSSECGARFYDLARKPINCPICGSLYEIASSPVAVSAFGGDDRGSRKPKRPEYVIDKGLPAEAAPEVAEEALADIEAVEGEEIAAEADETFLEEEEETAGGDVSNIIGPVPEGGEEV